MLHVFYGNDIEKRTKALERFLEKLKKDQFDIEYFSDSDISPQSLSSIIYCSNLFGSKTALVLKHSIDNEEKSVFVLEKISEMSDSENLFIIVETDLKKPVLKDLEHANAEIEFFKTEKKVAEKPVIFSFTDSFGSRDKKNAWIIFRKMRDDNVSAEEIIPALFWAIKNALIVYKQQQNKLSPESTKLSPFVHKKALSMTNKFSDIELSYFLESLNHIYHEARSGNRDLDKDLELFILKALA
ncbi:hypothetical protein IPJ63_01390 [Candidatus Nomurabacteria bacterium]|nr:MAG: hypothetical protein IPJ63_01390 [Candidatus Nomurabacteria bacterium]